jgi:hypothetical protein
MVFSRSIFNERRKSNKSWNKKFASQLDIEFIAIQSSKGLQADYVILIGQRLRRKKEGMRLLNKRL